MAKVSPTQRTLAECRKRGYPAQVVEQTIPRTFIKRDLFGCIDIIAIERCCPEHANGECCAPKVLAIQATSNNGGNHSARRAKILAEPRIRAWLLAGGRFEIWSWAKQGARGKRKAWTLRAEEITLADFADGAVKA